MWHLSNDLLKNPKCFEKVCQLICEYSNQEEVSPLAA